jgi:hypothetical protein
VARAKRTDRADARRRYRATQADVPDGDLDAEDGDAAGAADAATPAGRQSGNRGQSRSNAGSPPPNRPERPSFTGSFRAAARPFNIKSDLAYIPDLVLHTRAVWIPAALALAATVLTVLSNGPNTLIALLVQLFLYPPTIAGAFLAGILAPRATYMAGGIAGLIGSILFVILVLAAPNNLVALAGGSTATGSPSPSVAASGSAAASASPAASAGESASPAPSPSAAPATTIDITSAGTLSAIAESIFISTIFGIAIGGAGGYYKRFLYASNPSRQRRQLEQQRQKSQRGQPPKRRF